MRHIHEAEKAMLIGKAHQAPFGAAYSQQMKEPPDRGLVDIKAFNARLKEAVLSKLESLVETTDWRVETVDSRTTRVTRDKFVIDTHDDTTYLYHEGNHITSFTEQQANDLNPHANIVRKILLDAMDRYVKEIEQGV